MVICWRGGNPLASLRANPHNGGFDYLPNTKPLTDATLGAKFWSPRSLRRYRSFLIKLTASRPYQSR
jgi:hypothetical protein